MFLKGAIVLPRWTWGYSLAQAKTMRWPTYLRQLAHLYRRGHSRWGLRLALSLERRAVAEGDQLKAERIHAYVASLSSEVVVSHRATIAELQQAAMVAADHQNWADALRFTAQILDRRPQDPSVRMRALANWATGLHTVGRLSEACQAYDALFEDAEAWAALNPAYQSGYRLNREALQWYLGRPVDRSVLAAVTPDFSRSPSIWTAYWWLLGHVSGLGSTQRLRQIRASSLRSFGWDWKLEWDRALWGLDLFIADKDTVVVAERRVRQALADPATRESIGLGTWFDLYADWLIFLESRRPHDLSVAASTLIEWCQQSGFDGWARYWIGRTASSLDASSQ